ncbi:hypothetical protein PVNG_02156 [Plasmodium vivax North Korean]|uniref:Variable surface protein n=1 Tax=Plasmodium vivax North Korean TaxID=1035514 RepID=A0A0J9WDP6_PLAVI|nr:hypothetical protein PVNG_02156 [Plasmodium vivax North Korean]
MSYSIKDFDEWKQEYPLLKDILITYDDFDNDIKTDPNKNDYILVCRYFIKPWNEGKEEDKEFCMKLVRNLGHRTKNSNFLSYTTDRCRNLNNWAYNSMKKHSIPEKILTSCFEEYKYIVEGMRKKPTCFYYDYDRTYEEPMNIIMLNIFASNIDIFKKILEGKIDPVHCSCQKYVNKIVEIYKYMKGTYCSSDIIMRNLKTCQQLDSFKGTYEFLYNYATVKDKIPSLEYEKHVNLLGCESGNSLGGRPSTDTYPKEKPVETPLEPQFKENNDSSNSMSPTVSTALGTVAGASSLLALLYKVNAKIHLNMKTTIYNSVYIKITY